MTLAELRKRHDELLAESKTILQGVDGPLDDEARQKLDDLKEQRAGILATIEAREALEKEERLARASTERPNPADGTAPASDEVRVGSDREAEQPYASFGEQLLDIREAYTPGGEVSKRLLHVQEKYGERAASGMNQGSPSDGGFLVDPEFSNRIWNGVGEESDSLIAMTDTQRVTGESLTFKANAETSRATGSRWGGVRGYWIAEADEITSSNPKLRDVKVEPHELAVLVYVTDKLLRNSPIALGQFVERAARDEINFMTGDAIINGTGAGKPLGILNSGSLVTVAAEGSQASGTILHQNVVKMWARLHPASRSRAVWLHNVDVEPELMNIFLPVTNVAGSENVGGRDQRLYNPDTKQLLGRPTMPTEFNATLGTVGDLILWDPLGYLTGVREGIRTAMSMHVRFVYAEQAFRFMYEVDGQPWLNSAITPYKGSNTLTTHVALATR